MATAQPATTDGIGPTEGFIKLLSFAIIGLYISRRWF